ncbi:MAG: YcjX family protein [Phycisphaerales bacterium]|nr:YcjX family protein [Phycisphaerales bacterium]
MAAPFSELTDRLRRVRRRPVRLGIVGLSQSGKTAFTTALINHLRRHDPRRLPLGNGTVTLDWVARLPTQGGLPEFPYERCRDMLGLKREWPRKTVATSEYRCLLHRSDWPSRSLDLDLLDFPGERLADLSMAGRSFRQWSESVLALLRTVPEYHAHADEYLALVGSAAPPDEILAAYRRLLSRFVGAYLPVITPSSFLVTPTGDYVDMDRFNAEGAPYLEAHRLIGLDAATQFAPLPESAGELASEFDRHYRGYRAQVVDPLARWLSSCTELAILIDVAQLLSGGSGYINGVKRNLSFLLSHLALGQRPWHALAGNLAQFLSLERIRLRGVRRIAFIATKADRIHRDDHAKLEHLLRDLIPDAVKDAAFHAGLRFETFVCAAVSSTTSLEYPMLQARLPGHEGESVFPTSSVPSEWPESLPPLRYRFPRVLPSAPEHRDTPPRHIGLDRAINFLLGMSGSDR